ncbi:hypothetical protein AALB39_04010 [Lachnospiraceae bacterium 54-53]
MKPLVYFDFEKFEVDSNFVLVDKKRLQEILEEVYNAGFSDGSKTKHPVVVPTHDNWRTPCYDGEIYTNTPVPKRGVTISCVSEIANKS